MKTQKNKTKTSGNSKQPAKQLSKRDQKATNGGGILGGDDNSSLTSSLGVNLHSSHTDEDGQTESNSFGGNIGSGTQSMND
jgi:hypothetical protein